MSEIGDAFLSKARESLAGAASELSNGRYNNTANRCYYACFQAAIAALDLAGVRPPGGTDAWSHRFVQAQFAGVLINRRKLYSADLRDVLNQTVRVREQADYRIAGVSQAQASRALTGPGTRLGHRRCRTRRKYPMTTNIDDQPPEQIAPDEYDPRIKAALEETARAHPAALSHRHFHRLSRGGSRRNLPHADHRLDDLDEVADLFTDRLVDMQVEEGLPVYVVPDWPIERVREHLRHHAEQPVEARLLVPSG